LGSGFSFRSGYRSKCGFGPCVRIQALILLIHFLVTFVVSLAVVQVKILANQKVINPQIHGHVDLGRGPAVSKPLNFYFSKSKAKRGPKVVVSAAAEERLSDTLGLMGMPPLVAQEPVELENVDAGWWKRKEVGLVLLWVLLVQGFLLLNLRLRWVHRKLGFLQNYPWKILRLRL
jgi:hypothetical protein